MMVPNYLHGVYILAIVSAAVFFFRRRRFDAILVGAVATAVYFMPGLWGSITFPYGANEGYYASPVVPGAYLIMLVVVVTLVVVTYAYDKVDVKLGEGFAVPDGRAPEVVCLIMLLGVAVSVATIGKGYLCTDNAATLTYIDHWYYIASYSAPLAFTSGVAARKWGIVSVSAAVLACDLFIGFRGAVSVSLIGVCLIFGAALFGPRKSRIAFCILVGLAVVSLFLVKQLAWNIKYTVSVDCPAATNSVSVEEMVAGKPVEFHVDNLKYTSTLLVQGNTYLDAIRYLEPMVIGATLNETVDKGFTILLTDVEDQILSIVPGGTSVFGIDLSGVRSFNSRFQPVFFPYATFGMAANPWAQAYAAGGLALVIVFALVYACGLAVFAAAMRVVPPVSRAFMAVAVGWWGFYLHRNDVLTQVGLMKMTIYIAVAAMLISCALCGTAKLRQIWLGQN